MEIKFKIRTKLVDSLLGGGDISLNSEEQKACIDAKR
jgi:hypothetical protein